MRVCKNCQINYDDSHLFCSKCGNPTEQPLKLCSCGYFNEEDSKFCVFCGKPFVSEEETVEIPPVKTGSWWKTLIVLGAAFLILSAVCLIIKK